MSIPDSVLKYCQAHDLNKPRIVPTCGRLRASADHPKKGVVFVPHEVFQVSTVGNVAGDES